MGAFYVIDIETIPAMDLPEDCIPKFDEESVKLGNLKDPFKIKEKIEEARLEFEAGLEKKMSLDPDLCQVCCFVAYGPATKQFVSDFARDREEEFELLDRAWAWIKTCLHERILLVSFNGLSFDLPVLQRRAMIQDVSVSASIMDALTRRYDNKNHIDLMQALGGRDPFSGKMNFHGLDYYLKRFCLGSKLADWDGSKVYPAFKEGRFDEIVQYCKSDVLNTVALFERVYPWIVLPRAEETKTETTSQKGK
jgi:hypothetical protein